MAKDQIKVEELEGGVRLITPHHILREKVGYGGIDPATLDRAEEAIAKAEVDFCPFAKTFLDRLGEELANCRKNKKTDHKALNALIRPVMELKANGGMFKYPLVTEIGDILLNFLEHLSELNDDALDVVDVHQKTLSVIIASKLTGNGGKEGKRLADELYGACQRYAKKHKSSMKA